MKHNVKFSDGTIQSIDCRMGSKIYDKWGSEIYEGDYVVAPWYTSPALIIFRDGTFFIDGRDCLTQLASNKLEVVGSATDDTLYRYQ